MTIIALGKLSKLRVFVLITGAVNTVCCAQVPSLDFWVAHVLYFLAKVPSQPRPLTPLIGSYPPNIFPPSSISSTGAHLSDDYSTHSAISQHPTLRTDRVTACARVSIITGVEVRSGYDSPNARGPVPVDVATDTPNITTTTTSPHDGHLTSLRPPIRRLLRLPSIPLPHPSPQTPLHRNGPQLRQASQTLHDLLALRPPPPPNLLPPRRPQPRPRLQRRRALPLCRRNQHGLRQRGLEAAQEARAQGQGRG